MSTNKEKDLSKVRAAIVTERFRASMKQWMLDNKVTQAQMARRAGLTTSIINNVINSHAPSLTNANLIARAMNTTVDKMTAGQIADAPDVTSFSNLFKQDFLKNVKATVENGKYYSNELIDLSEKQKRTIIRLIYAYLNVGKTGKYLGDDINDSKKKRK